jgi:hypothetical protein
VNYWTNTGLSYETKNQELQARYQNRAKALKPRGKPYKPQIREGLHRGFRRNLYGGVWVAMRHLETAWGSFMPYDQLPIPYRALRQEYSRLKVFGRMRFCQASELRRPRRFHSLCDTRHQTVP